MPLPPQPRVVMETPPDYWIPTERELAVANHKDSRAAEAVNAGNLLLDASPFGELPRGAAT